MMRDALKQMREAEQASYAASHAYLTAVKKAYPVGAIVTWMHGERKAPRSARVCGHSMHLGSPRVWVKSLVTGKEYGVELYSIAQYEDETTAGAQP